MLQPGQLFIYGCSTRPMGSMGLVMALRARLKTVPHNTRTAHAQKRPSVCPVIMVWPHWEITCRLPEAPFVRLQAPAACLPCLAERAVTCRTAINSKSPSRLSDEGLFKDLGVRPVAGLGPESAVLRAAGIPHEAALAAKGLQTVPAVPQAGAASCSIRVSAAGAKDTRDKTVKLPARDAAGSFKRCWQRPTFPHDVMQYHRRWRA